MMRVTRLVAVLVLGLLVPLTSYAGVDEIRHDAMQGNTSAQYEMGILYEFGFHLADHETEALAWYEVAAQRGSEPAARRRDLLSARLSSAQRAQAEQRRNEILTGMPAAQPAAQSAMPAPETAQMPAPEAATPVPEVAPATPTPAPEAATPIPTPAPAPVETPTPAPQAAPSVAPESPTTLEVLPMPAPTPPPAESAPKP